jgi:hypothetical protein
MKIKGYISNIDITPNRVGYILMGTADIELRIVGATYDKIYSQNDEVEITIEPIPKPAIPQNTATTRTDN